MWFLTKESWALFQICKSKNFNEKSSFLNPYFDAKGSIVKIVVNLISSPKNATNDGWVIVIPQSHVYRERIQIPVKNQFLKFFDFTVC